MVRHSSRLGGEPVRFPAVNALNDTTITDPAAGSAPTVLPADAGFDHRAFREAMGSFATGVTVVTMTATPLTTEPQGADGQAQYREVFGITVNAFMSVSLEPPLVAVSIDQRARAHATLHEAERFGVSILGEAQAHLSDQFAGRPVARPEAPFEELDGFPVLRGAVAQLVLRRESAFRAGDHTIFLGRVEALRRFGGEPLLYFRSGYHRLPTPAQPR